jgi:predicted hydrocarbon binding protein
MLDDAPRGHVSYKRPREKLYSIPRCKECGLPVTLRLLFNWRDDGVITLRWFSKDFRFVVLYQELLNRLFDVLVEQFGEEAVDEIAWESEKGSASEYVAMIFLSNKLWLKPLSFLIRYTRFLNVLLEQNSALLGYGAVQVVEKKLPNARIYIRNPYRLSLFRADGDGVYEVARERRMRLEIEQVSPEEDIYYFVGTTPDMERKRNLFHSYRIKPEPIRKVAAPLAVPRCPRCGIPRPISYYLWDERLGIIVSRLSGRRIILWPDYALEKMLTAFEYELGDEAREIMFDITREFWIELISSKGIGLSPEEQVMFLEAGTQERYEILLDQLAYLGFGRCTRVEIEESPYRVKIEIVNASTPAIISGVLAGMFEALEDRAVTVEMEERQDSVVYYLS